DRTAGPEDAHRPAHDHRRRSPRAFHGSGRHPRPGARRLRRLHHRAIGMSQPTRVSHIDQVPFAATPQYDGAIRPELFVGRREARLAKPLGLTQFGVNQVELNPGAATALRHWHETEDEFVYVLAGTVTLIDDNGAHD